MSSLLSAAELGNVGEKLFEHLCSRARLNCNPSHRDLYGWDFRVEFPEDSSSRATLDQQRHRVCMVQVKSTAGESGFRVSARLSSIGRLAKDAGPAIVVILRLRPDGTEVAGYLFHLIDEELARILRRLRRAEADGRADINHMTISFDRRKGRRFKPDAEGLAAALSEACPEDVGAYTVRKQFQLENLGYDEPRGVETEALVWIESRDHLVRVLSGLAPLKPVKMQSYDRRFGIRLPYQGDLLDGIEEFLIQLPAVGSADVVVRGGARRPAALFRCEAFAPPPIEGGPLMVIKHPALTVVFKDDGLDFQTVDNFRDGRRGLEEWALLLRGLTYLASGTGTIELEFRGVRLVPLPVPPGQLDGPYLDHLPRLFAFVDQWRQLLDLAGMATDEPFGLDDIWEAEPVHVALDMLFNPEPAARIEFEVAEGADGESSLEALYFNAVEFAGAKVAFAVKATFERVSPTSDTFASARYELLDARPGVTDLSAYGAERAADAQLRIVFDPTNMMFTNGEAILLEETS